MQIVNPQDFDQQNQQKMDEQLLVRFLLRARQDDIATREAGRPIYKDTEYIETVVPAMTNRTTVKKAQSPCSPIR